jgi:dihydrofolate reductase
MANYVFIATSLDGFIATKEGGLDWLNEIPNPDQNDYGYNEFKSGIDAIVMGRNTFEKVLTFDFWPYDKPVFVLSNSLKSVPERLAEKAEIINGDLNVLVDKLEKRGLQNLYVDGGRVIQSFLKEDLIDEMVITWVPILLGDGISLFGKLENSLKFSLKKTESFNETLVQSHYIRLKKKNFQS